MELQHLEQVVVAELKAHQKQVEQEVQVVVEQDLHLILEVEQLEQLTLEVVVEVLDVQLVQREVQA